MKYFLVVFLAIAIPFTAACGSATVVNNTPTTTPTATPVVAATPTVQVVPKTMGEKIALWQSRNENKKYDVVFLDEAESKQFLREVSRLHKLLSQQSLEKVWMQGNSVGVPNGQTQIGDRFYEFYVTKGDLGDTSFLWFRVTAKDDGFPKERVSFEYDHDIGIGFLEMRHYEHQGGGVPIANTTLSRKRFTELLKLTDKIAAL